MSAVNGRSHFLCSPARAEHQCMSSRVNNHLAALSIISISEAEISAHRKASRAATSGPRRRKAMLGSGILPCCASARYCMLTSLPATKPQATSAWHGIFILSSALRLTGSMTELKRGLTIILMWLCLTRVYIGRKLLFWREVRRR